MQGKSMIETIYKIPATKIDYVEYECKKCQNSMRFSSSVGLTWACPVCGFQFSKEDLAFIDAIKGIAYYQKETNNKDLNLTVNFLSVENGR